MAKHKLLRFAETAQFPNFIQVPYKQALTGCYLKGLWNKDFFKNEQPLWLELGCGKGEYTVGLAQKYPERNNLGIDIKGARMWRGAKTALENNISNVGFLRTEISLIESFFAKDEVSGIWITFPDPYLKNAKSDKRLTSQHFLSKYSNVLKPGAEIHLKTDNRPLYEYTLDVIKENGHSLLFETNDLYSLDIHDEASSIQTFYEQMWLAQGLKINYIRFTLK
ncbi:MAG: tRNA (guanosine(46)-N7)-methyltransferase TrmB [Bacteroidota bacterium]